MESETTRRRWTPGDDKGLRVAVMHAWKSRSMRKGRTINAAGWRAVAEQFDRSPGGCRSRAQRIKVARVGWVFHLLQVLLDRTLRKRNKRIGL